MGKFIVPLVAHASMIGFQHFGYIVCFRPTCTYSALMLLVEWQEGHLACKQLGGGMLAWLCVWVKVQICIWPS